MYVAQITTERIKAIAKERGISLATLQEQCDLSKNAIQLAGKSEFGLKAKNLYNIAEILDCSVDYLLGRSDTVCPSDNIIIQTGDVNAKNNKGDVDVDTSVNITADPEISKETSELLDLLQSLPLVKRAEAILYLNKLKEE